MSLLSTTSRAPAHRAMALLLCALPCMAYVAGGAGAGVRDADEVRTRRVLLVDETGRTRASFALDENGDPKLALCDAAGQERVVLAADLAKALCVLRDADGQNRVGMAVDQYPHLMLHDAGQKPRIHASVGASGAPSLLFVHVDGTFPSGIGVKATGEGWLKPERLPDTDRTDR